MCSWVLPVSRYHMDILFKTVINVNYHQNFFAYAKKTGELGKARFEMVV